MAGADPAPGRRRAVAVGLGVLVAVLLPVALWGAVVREAVLVDIVRRAADDRSQAARLAASSIGSTLGEVDRRIELTASRDLFRDALARRDATALERHLADLRHGTTYATTLVLDASGRLLARDPAARESYGQSFADRDYFAGATSSAGPYISEAVVSRISAETVVVVARAVRSDGALTGVILVTLAPPRILDQLVPLRSTPGRELHLVDQRSRVIASTDPGRAPLSELPRAAADRVETIAPVERSPWVLVVSDAATVVLASQRRIEREMLTGGIAIAALALACSAGIGWLFATTARQRALLAQREAALERTNLELAAASRHKSEFLAGMSHELRTPLNAILGFSDLLIEQLGPSMQRESRYLRNIKEAGAHLLGLINDVLDLSKVEAGRLELRPERTTVGALVKPLLASTTAQAQMRGLAFECHVPDACELHVDAVRLRQILYNLLSNAVKFTPKGGRVTLRMAARDADLDIEVSDTGIGIPAGRRDRVFGVFERLHEGRFEASGTGLGLALTKQLVEAQGGTILFTSVEGEGTTFHVRLPDAVVRAVRGDRVLVVEDDARDAELVAELAARVGLEAEVVRTADEAIAAIRRSPPLAVVLDLQLAAERGERVLERIRSQPATRRIPVIVVTVEDDDGRSASLGADAHLTKPIRPATLAEHLERARRQHKEAALATAAGR